MSERQHPGARADFQVALRMLRLGVLGTLGLYMLLFLGVQAVYYLWGGLLGLPGIYAAEGGILGQHGGAWIVSLGLLAAGAWFYLRGQDERNRRVLTRTWDSWKWFDHGVDMFGTEDEFGEEQERSFSRASMLDENDPYARNNLGAVLWHQGRIDEAVGFYREAIRKNPDYYKAWGNLGAACARRGELEKAMGFYRKALELNPRDSATHLNIGLALARSGRNAQAATHLRQFLSLEPGHPRAAEVKEFIAGLR